MRAMGYGAAARASSSSLARAYPCVRRALCALLAASVPAGAADRSSVARIPKPSAAGEPWAPTERAALRASLDALFADASPLRGRTRAIALETRSGAVLYERNSARALPARLDGEARDGLGRARAARPGISLHDGTPRDRADRGGELQGDLVLHGGGDPLLAAADLDDAAAAVASAGVRRIAGSVRADARISKRSATATAGASTTSPSTTCRCSRRSRSRRTPST